MDKRIDVGDDIVETNVGFLTDKTGSGKTLMILGLICRDKMNWDMDLTYTIEKKNM